MIAVIEICSRLLFWGVLYLAAARIGAWLTRSELRGAAHLAWDGLSGLPLLVSLWLAAGLVRFDRFVVLGVASLLVAVAFHRAWKDPVRRFDRRARATPALVGVAVLLGSALFIGMLWNRVPVLFYDSLAYHFAQPESWILEHRIAPYDWSLHSWFPPGMSVLYGVGLILGGEPWANDANLVVGLALLLCGFDLGRRHWGDAAGWTVVLALLAVPQILFALAIPAADLAHATFVVGALASLTLFGSTRDSAWLRRAGWIAAGAMLTKYLGFLVPLATGFLFCLLDTRPHSPLADRARRAAVFCLPALILLSPWLLANGTSLGNPVAPILSGWLETEGLAPGGVEAFTRDARGGLPDWTAVRALGPRLFAGTSGGIYPSPAWGWFFAPWLLVVLAGSRIDPLVRRAAVVAALLFVLWFLTYRWERFLIPVAFFVCLALAGTLHHAAHRSRAGALAAVAVLLAGVATIPKSVTSIETFTGAGDLFLGRESRTEFLARSWPLQRLLQAPAIGWKSSDRMLLVGEMRHFRIPVRRAAPSGFNLHPFALSLERSQAPEQVHERLRRAGYTHLLIDLGWVERSAGDYPSLRGLTESPEKLVSYVGSLGRPLASEGRRALFRIPEQR